MNQPFSKKTLWLITTGYVAAIYLTLGPVGRLSIWLRSLGWQTAVSIAIMIFAGVIVLYIIVIVLKRRSIMNLVTLAAAGGMYIYIMSAFAPNPSDKIHLIEYSILAWIIYYALKMDISPKSAYVLAWSLTTVIGFVDEMIQYYLPTRAYDLNDLMTNTMAAGVALLVVGLVVESNE